MEKKQTHQMNKQILPFLIGFCLITSCSTTDKYSQLSVISNGPEDKLREVIDSLDAFRARFEKLDVKSLSLRSAIAEVYAVERPVTKATSGFSQDTILYVVNFEDSLGFAVLSAGEDNDPPGVLCLADKGYLGPHLFETVFQTELITDTLLLPALLLKSGSKPFLRQTDPIDDPTIGGGGPSGIHGPFLETKWNQSPEPYDSLTPGGCPVGCVALAVAQIMAFEEYSNTMVFNGVECDWDSMKTVKTHPSLSYGTSEGRMQLANFLLEMGSPANCNIVYGPDNSSGYAIGARRTLQNYGYTNVNATYGLFGFTSAQKSVVRNQLFSGHPVYCDGSNFSTGAGHAWVIDGYFAGYYHINWGWEGDCDGYYSEGLFDTTEIDHYSNEDPGSNTMLRLYDFDFTVITYARP